MPRPSALTSIVVLTMAAGLSAWSSVTRTRSVWDGVYTETQASRGERSYRQICARCHGPALVGTESGPELVGEPFLDKWYGRPVVAFAEATQQTMPQDDPGSMSRRQTADMLAYVFRANGFPSGPEDLPTTPGALAEILIARRPQ